MDLLTLRTYWFEFTCLSYKLCSALVTTGKMFHGLFVYFLFTRFFICMQFDGTEKGVIVDLRDPFLLRNYHQVDYYKLKLPMSLQVGAPLRRHTQPRASGN